MTVPAVFEMDEREHGAVVGDHVPAELEDEVRRAVVLCPEEAITTHER
jgi:ferredoxin